MNLIRAKKIIFLSLLFIISFTGFSQTITVSPYSRFGLGDVPFTGFNHNTAMGGAGIALDSSYHLNLLNPAGNSSIELSTFEAGVFSNFTQFQTDSSKKVLNNTSLSYLVFGVPVTKWWGMSFGLVPFSGLNYHVFDTTIQSGTGRVVQEFIGSGGSNRAFISNGFRIKRFSAGFSIGYIFGETAQTKSLYLPDLSSSYNLRKTNSYYLNDISYDFGIQYKHVYLNRKQKMSSISAGLTFSPEQALHFKQLISVESFVDRNNIAISKDTASFTENNKAFITLPTAISGGLCWTHSQKLKLLADVSTRNWSNFSFISNDTLKQSMRISAGAQYTPDPNVASFAKLVQYRIGFYTEQLPAYVKGIQISERALSIGAGLPLRKTRTTMNVALVLGTRGTTDNMLLQENFLRFHFGMTFNDKWFIKRKID